MNHEDSNIRFVSSWLRIVGSKVIVIRWRNPRIFLLAYSLVIILYSLFGRILVLCSFLRIQASLYLQAIRILSLATIRFLIAGEYCLKRLRFFRYLIYIVKCNMTINLPSMKTPTQVIFLQPKDK